MRRTIGSIGVAVVVALAGAGCGSAGDRSDTEPSSSAEPSTTAGDGSAADTDAVTAALEAVSGADTLAFGATYVADGPITTIDPADFPQTNSATPDATAPTAGVTGAVDRSGGQVWMARPDSAGPDVVVVDGDVWVSAGAIGTDASATGWLLVDTSMCGSVLTRLQDATGSSSEAPEQWLEAGFSPVEFHASMVLNAMTGATHAGTTDVDGETIDTYRVSVDPAAWFNPPPPPSEGESVGTPSTEAVPEVDAPEVQVSLREDGSLYAIGAAFDLPWELTGFSENHPSDPIAGHVTVTLTLQPAESLALPAPAEDDWATELPAGVDLPPNCELTGPGRLGPSSSTMPSTTEG